MNAFSESILCALGALGCAWLLESLSHVGHVLLGVQSPLLTALGATVH